MGKMKHNLLAGRQAAISAIRLLSLVMIITCHIFQYLDNELAWWFNAGVQIFLCVSGFLFGQRHIDDIRSFLENVFNAMKIDVEIVIDFGLRV